ncbi:Major sperm protein [Trichostrongylus colubriformis]|uniref:Major sperm protein n=1 Tax=Trichostrongylus colubriformis TaxID=6319 RepID=A0AAN8F4I5_TRICO
MNKCQVSMLQGDGNYEDVNLVEAEAPEHQKAQLTIDPLKASFAASGGRSTHTLLNAGDARVVFKVKCSNNHDYRIKPVYGYVDPIGSHLIFVVRLPGPVKDDKMVVQWGAAAAEKTEPVVAFKKLAPTSLQQIVVPFTVTAGGPAGAKPSPGAAVTSPSPSPAPKPAGAAKVPASSPKKK